LLAVLPDGCGASFGVYDIEVPLLLVCGGRATAPPDATGCELSVGVYDG
jgi:hypothetical protein